MAITSELLGKIGKMDSEPIEGSVSGSTGSTVVMKTIEIPPGETWLVSVVGTMSASSTSTNLVPNLILGGSSVLVHGKVGISSIETGEVRISIKRRTLSGTDSFVGELYTIKL